MKKFYFLGLFALSFILSCSTDDEPVVSGEFSSIIYDPQTYDIPQPVGFSKMAQPANNIATVEGVDLGHLLFFDPILSADSTLSCSGCHLPEFGFTDGNSVSTGITNIAGSRSSMSLINIGYVSNGLFWDGGINNLEAQALMPVEDPIEMAASWPDIVERIRTHDVYPELFRKAFGIESRSDIDKFMVAKAIAQYERSIVSANSRYDQYLSDDPNFEFEDEEFEGLLMFFDEPTAAADAECFHCHGGANLGSNEFFNNGLDAPEDLVDLGRENITGNEFDRGKFRAASLRNLELTAPYMHDGRILDLESVVDFYSDSIHISGNLDVNLSEPINLNEEEKGYLLAFLRMLTDTSYLSDPHFLNPFE